MGRAHDESRALFFRLCYHTYAEYESASYRSCDGNIENDGRV